MVSLSLSVSEQDLQRLSEIASRQEVAPEELIGFYVTYLLAGGEPVDDEEFPTAGLMKLAELGGSFDWLKDEPDIYSEADAEPYG